MAARAWGSGAGSSRVFAIQRRSSPSHRPAGSRLTSSFDPDRYERLAAHAVEKQSPAAVTGYRHEAGTDDEWNQAADAPEREHQTTQCFCAEANGGAPADHRDNLLAEPSRSVQTVFASIARHVGCTRSAGRGPTWRQPDTRSQMRARHRTRREAGSHRPHRSAPRTPGTTQRHTERARSGTNESGQRAAVSFYGQSLPHRRIASAGKCRTPQLGRTASSRRRRGSAWQVRHADTSPQNTLALIARAAIEPLTAHRSTATATASAVCRARGVPAAPPSPTQAGRHARGRRSAAAADRNGGPDGHVRARPGVALHPSSTWLGTARSTAVAGRGTRAASSRCRAQVRRRVRPRRAPPVTAVVEAVTGARPGGRQGPGADQAGTLTPVGARNDPAGRE